MALDKITEFISNQIVLIETAASRHKIASALGDASMLLPLLCTLDWSLLDGDTSEQVAGAFSSHDLKAILLSWVAKSGKFSA